MRRPLKEPGWPGCLAGIARFPSMARSLDDLADEVAWLRFFIRRLRVTLRFAKDPQAVAVLRELIAEAEKRLAYIVARRDPFDT